MKFIQKYLLILLIFIVFSCTENTIYSGKIINQEKLNDIKILDKKDLIKKFGNPSFIDPIENKYFYYTEKTKEKNFFNKKTEYSYLFIFLLNENNEVISQKAYNLLDKNEIKLAEKETENKLIERGFIERIFGGVGAQKLPNSE